MSQFLVVALLGAGVPVASVAVAAPAARKQAAKAKPKKAPPISAEHKKALAELYGGFKFGMTKDEVVAVFAKQLDERYDEQIKSTTDIAAQDRIRRDKKAEVARLASSYIAFDSAKTTPWDVSIVEDEFAHNTGESMLERWENQGGKNQRRFFFFVDGKLWKMFVSLDMSILPADKKNFATFQAAMEDRYGVGEVEPGKIRWRAGEFEVRALDKLKTYDALALAIEDPRARGPLEAVRAAKAPPRRETSTVIKAVIDTKHDDHPDVKANNNAVDDVLRANGAPAKP